MSHTESPPESEPDHLRVIVTEYDDNISEAAKLVAFVRNEINNSLAALLGQTQLLLREDLSEKSRRRVEVIEGQIKRIVEIVSKLRTLQ